MCVRPCRKLHHCPHHCCLCCHFQCIRVTFSAGKSLISKALYHRVDAACGGNFYEVESGSRCVGVLIGDWKGVSAQCLHNELLSFMWCAVLCFVACRHLHRAGTPVIPVVVVVDCLPPPRQCFITRCQSLLSEVERDTAHLNLYNILEDCHHDTLAPADLRQQQQARIAALRASGQHNTWPLTGAVKQGQRVHNWATLLGHNPPCTVSM